MDNVHNIREMKGVFEKPEKTKEAINTLINTIKTNKTFSKLIIYSLNTLKNFLMLSNPIIVIENSTTILNENFFELIEHIADYHKNNEELMINVGEVIFYLININNKIEDILFENFIKHNGMNLLVKLLNNLPLKQTETYKIYLKIINLIVEYKKYKDNDMTEFWLINLKLMEKFENNADVMIYNLDSVRKFSSLKKFRDLINQEFVDLIIRIISNTEFQKVATIGLQILDIIIKIPDVKQMIRNTKPLTFIVKLLTKFMNDDILSFHCCAFLSQIIEKEDISSFLIILKIKSFNDIHLETEGMISEISEMLNNNKEEDTLKVLKRNIMRVLVLMSKDKAFIQLMKNINSLEHFLFLLKSDLKLYEDKQNNRIEITNEVNIIINLLPDFILLVISILKNYDLSQFDLNTSNSMIQFSNEERDSIVSTSKNESECEELVLDIFYCLLKSIYIFSNNLEIVTEVFEFISSKEITKKLFADYDKFLNVSEFQSTLYNVYRNFHNSRWVYIYLNKFSSYLVDPKDNVINLVKDLEGMLESYKLIPDSTKKTNIIDTSFSISLKLMTNVQFTENTFHEFIKVSNQFYNFLTSEYDNELLIPYINILFSAAENKYFGIKEEKLKFIFMILKKINLNSQSDIKIFSYFIFRILRISTERDSKILKKESNLNHTLLTDESILYLIINLLSEIKLCMKKEKETELSWEESLKDVLSLIYLILNMGNSVQIARFLRDNGLIMIIQICSVGLYDFDINKIIIQILQALSMKHFKESIQNFKNYIIFKNFISQIKDIKFSKGINEKIYFEILTFLKNIIKVCEYTEGMEETNLVEHIINEFNEIYFFYLDTNNRILEILAEILSIISKEKCLLKNLINSKLPNTIDTIFKNLNENTTEEIEDKIIEFLTNIYINFIKSKDYSNIIYTNFRSSLEYIKNIISHFKLPESCQLKMVNLFQIIIEYENKEVSKDQVLTPIFFKQLLLQIPSTQVNVRNILEKCVQLIENPLVDRFRNSINQSNLKLIKELHELAKTTRIPKVEDRKSTCYFTSRNSLNPDNYIDSEKTIIKRKSMICLKDNPDVLDKFENIVTSINNIVDILDDQYTFYNKDLECEQLCDLVKMLIIFSKEEENLKMIFDSGIMEKIIKIIENDNNILIFAQDQCYILIGKFVETPEYLNYFFENVRICQYFLKLLLNNICDKFHKDSPEYIKNKYLISCKVISCLSSDKVFLINNSDLNIPTILDIISKIDYDKDIVSYILITLNNILSFQLSTIEGEIDFQKHQIYETAKIAKIFQNLWTNFQSEIRIVEKVIKLIETLYIDEFFIKEIIELDFIDYINLLLKNQTLDSECIQSLFELFDKLMLHRTFCYKLYDQKTMSILLNTFEANMINTKIIEKSSTIILKCCKKDKNFISIMGLFGINEYCIKMMSKYMNTCHLSILKQNLEIIFYLVSDENNLLFFYKPLNMEILLKCFLHNIKTKEIVLLNLKLVSVITTKEMGLSKQQEYDISLIIEIVNEVLANYDESLDIIIQLCELIKNIFRMTNEIWIKKILIDVIFNNSDKYVSKQDFIELFLNTLYIMIKTDKNIIDLTCSSILFYIAKNLNCNLNGDMLYQILKIFRHITNTKSLDFSSHLNDIIKILKLFEQQTILHNDDLMIFFTEILCNLCLNTSFYKEISNEFIGFVLEYSVKHETNMNTHSKLLENVKNISVFIHIENEQNGDKVAEILTKIFNRNLNENNKKNLINLFQVISALCLQSDYIKSSLLELKFKKKLKEIIKSKTIDDNLLEYQIKGCLLNLKQNNYSNSKKMTNASSLTTMSTIIPNVELKEEVKEFLRTERKIKFYTEKGEVKDRFIFWNQSLDTIYAGKKVGNNYEYTDTMNVQDMESCVRSAATNAFKSKGIFAKKPKANKCFSILGIKTFKGQKTFNVECEKEEECIKYVDYISIIIQNYKALKEV